MKKVKLMLLSLSILAVVAGALAFKVNTGVQICTAAVKTDGTCPAFCPSPRFLADTPPTQFICTAPTIVGGINACQTDATHTTACNVNSVLSALE
jgi:hypothetical protein